MKTFRTESFKWWSLVTAGSVAVAFGMSGYLDLKDSADQARADRDALYAQVRELGGTPVAGTPGKDGQPGPSGAPGRDGRDGADGKPGGDGSPGPTGKTGSVGPSGAPGSRGDTGAAGPTGPVGPQGPIGPVGPVGPQGPAGEKGDKGDKGDPGQSVACPDGSHPEEVVMPPYAGTYILCKKDGPE